MDKNRAICEKLKQIRLELARANDIEYEPAQCEHEGFCPGTCPACEKEVRYLEKELAKKNYNKSLVINSETDEDSTDDDSFELMGSVLTDCDPESLDAW